MLKDFRELWKVGIYINLFLNFFDKVFYSFNLLGKGIVVEMLLLLEMGYF